jgi:hypothetical protein
MHEPRHSGARASPASPEAKNTGKKNQWLGLCAWVPGPALTGRPGMTREFFSTLLMLTFGVVAVPAAGAQPQRPVQLLPLPGIAPAWTPAPLTPPINPGPAVAPPGGLSPILSQPGPLFPPPASASPSYRPPSLPGPIDQQKLRAYHNELRDRQWQRDRDSLNPDTGRSGAIRRQPQPPDGADGPQ